MNTQPTRDAKPVEPQAKQRLPADALRVVSSQELLQGQTCVNIEHAGAIYTLRATRSGKLILTK